MTIPATARNLAASTARPMHPLKLNVDLGCGEIREQESHDLASSGLCLLTVLDHATPVLLSHAGRKALER